MQNLKKIFFILIALVILVQIQVPAFAATGTCEIYYFTYSGAVGAGGTADIQTYLSSLGYSTARYANTHAYYVRRTMNSDKVFAIVANGIAGRIYCKDGATTVSAYSVSGDSANYSLQANFSNNALSGMIFAYYEKNLFRLLNSGYTIAAANTAAAAATYSNYSYYGNVDSARISGSTSTTIN